MTGRFGANPYKTATPAAAPVAAPATGRFGANPYSSLITPQGTAQTLTEGATLQSAQDKLKNGGVLNAAEAAAMARQQADGRALSAIAAALQPMLVPSDIIKGIASVAPPAAKLPLSTGVALPVVQATPAPTGAKWAPPQASLPLGVQAIGSVTQFAQDLRQRGWFARAAQAKNQAELTGLIGQAAKYVLPTGTAEQRLAFQRDLFDSMSGMK